MKHFLIFFATTFVAVLYADKETNTAKTDTASNSLLTQCDFNNNGKIDTKKTYKIDKVSKAVAKKEFKCSLKYEVAEIEDNIAEKEANIAEKEENIQMLNKKEKNDILRLKNIIGK